VLTVTTGYAYSTLAAGVALSFMTAALLMALVDPAVTLWRDRVRGRTLQPAGQRVRSAATPLPAGLRPKTS
jgi:hypothetical protein